jgi:hypothetical protein
MTTMHWGRRLSLAAFVTAVVVPAGAATTSTKLQPDDPVSGAFFGISTAIDGQTAAVGSMSNGPGAVYVYTRSGGAWPQQQKLVPDATGGVMGNSVGISGDTIVAGAPWESTKAPNAGAAYVFVRSGTTWTQQAKVFPSDPQQGGYFGMTAAIDGDTFVVGEPYASASAPNDQAGIAYVFVRTGTAWTEQARLVMNDPAFEDGFGSAVAVSGDTVIVGAQAKDDLGPGSGAAYVFTRSGTTWTFQQKLLASDGAAGDIFGMRLALKGDTAAISAWVHYGVAPASGQVYVFKRSGGTWSEHQKLQPRDAADHLRFGTAVAMTADRIAIGANGYASPGANAGAMYVYERQGDTWVEGLNWGAEDAAANDTLGSSIAISGGDILVGALRADTAGTDSGTAWLVELEPPLEVTSASLIPTQVTLTFPKFGEKKALVPGLRALGTIDTGSGAVDLTLACDLTVGSRAYDLPQLTFDARRGTYSYSDPQVTFTITMPKNGCSRGTFDLRVTEDLTGFVVPDGPLALGFSSRAVAAAVSVELTKGKFKLTDAPGALGPELMCCVSAKATLAGNSRDTFAETLRFGGDGTVPSTAPLVTVGFGGTFKTMLSPAKFKRQKSKWVFSDPRASGVYAATIDFAKGRATISARKCDLGAFATGPVPLRLTLGIDNGLRAVDVRAVVKGKSLKY